MVFQCIHESLKEAQNNIYSYVPRYSWDLPLTLFYHRHLYFTATVHSRLNSMILFRNSCVFFLCVPNYNAVYKMEIWAFSVIKDDCLSLIFHILSSEGSLHQLSHLTLSTQFLALETYLLYWARDVAGMLQGCWMPRNFRGNTVVSWRFII